jgi:hypothetical protein
VLQLWGGALQQSPLQTPPAPRIVKHDSSGKHTYAVIAVGPQGRRSDLSPTVTADGLATLNWGGAVGVGAYIVVRDGQAGTPFRMEGGLKSWTDPGISR